MLCKQMIYILTRTYFCKSCTKTYNFSTKITDSERALHFPLKFLPEYLFHCTHDGRQPPIITTGYEAAWYTV